MANCNSKYTKDVLQKAVTGSLSMAETMRKLGIGFISGGMHAYLKRRIAALGIDTSHFLGQARNRGPTHVGGPKKLTAKDIFVYDRSNGYREHAEYLRRALDEIGRERICAKCGGGTVWQEEELMLEVEHRNGDPLDNRQENLEYRCPNCHSQIPNHSKKGRG
jgi:hypothetical protein